MTILVSEFVKNYVDWPVRWNCIVSHVLVTIYSLVFSHAYSSIRRYEVVWHLKHVKHGVLDALHLYHQLSVELRRIGMDMQLAIEWDSICIAPRNRRSYLFVQLGVSNVVNVRTVVWWTSEYFVNWLSDVQCAILVWFDALLKLSWSRILVTANGLCKLGVYAVDSLIVVVATHTAEVVRLPLLIWCAHHFIRKDHGNHQ